MGELTAAQGARSRTYGSDLLVEQLCGLGIRHVVLNPGATIRGLHESLATAGAPEIVLATHEGIAVAIAHGYAKASGKPMAVALHNIVGLQHGTMALFNAWCDRVPMLVLGGSGPVAESRRRPWIDWIHAGRQGELVRDYVKWEHEPTELEALLHDVQRAWQLTAASPAGPVYLSIDTSLQEQHVPSEAGHALAALAIGEVSLPSPVAAPTGLLDEVAAELVNARQPVILAWGVGRRGSVTDLVQLAELTQAPVIEWTRAGTSFPSRHPLNGTHWSEELIAGADLVLALNVQNLAALLYVTDDMTRENRALFHANTRILHIGDDQLPWSSWTNEHGPHVRADLMLPVDAARALPELVKAVRLASKGQSAASRPVVARLAALHEEANARWTSEARTTHADGLTSANVAEVLGRSLGERRWVLANGSAAGWVHRLWKFTELHPYLGDSGGAGKGYGIGASIGAALALRDADTIVVDIQGDGDLLYTPGALWTAAHHQLPLLIVVLNNRSYFQDERHQLEMARARHRSSDRVAVGIRLEGPTPDYAGLARSFGVTAFGPVGSVSDLSQALASAIQRVELGMPALVDCIVVEKEGSAR